MGLLDIITGKYVDPTHFKSVHAGGNIITTTVDAVGNWGRKSSFWALPLGSSPTARPTCSSSPAPCSTRWARF